MMANEQVPSWKELTSEDKKYVEEHLNETDEARENAIAKIKRWIEESDDLRIRIDDFFILRFLRVCKFNLEKTKIRMQNYYKQRSDLPEWYMNKDAFLPELQELLDMGICLPLRKPDDQGRLVLLMRVTSHDPRIHKISDLVKMRNRVHTYSHNTMQNCFKDIPANILPVEYGGTDGTIQELIEFWKKRVEENRDWMILNEENYKVVTSEQ